MRSHSQALSWMGSSLGPHARRVWSRAIGVMEVVALLLLVGLAGVSLLQRSRGETDLLRYRLAMSELTDAVRTMRSRAVAQHRIMELHVDAVHGSFRLIAIHGRPISYEQVEQTLWLPEGLQINEAPSSITALPNGWLSPTSLVVTAPNYGRLFRLSTNERGMVRLDEDPTS